jgi:hypothetical protein
MVRRAKKTCHRIRHFAGVPLEQIPQVRHSLLCHPELCEQPPTAVPSTHFGGEARAMRDRHRRLAGGRDAVDVGGLEAGNTLLTSRSYHFSSMYREAYRAAVVARDTEITPAEVDTAIANVASGLDLNHFAHFWMDGILAESDVKLSVELDRRRLIAAARTCRSGQPLRLDSIVQYKDPLLDAAKVQPLLEEFVNREILWEEHGTYGFKLPLFEDWLVNAGVIKLMPEQSAQEQAVLARRPEDEAFVTATEITKITNGWPAYRGQPIGPERVRAWLGQLQSNLDQRILFKLLERLRFVSEKDIREKLSLAHRTVRMLTSTVFRK